MNLSLPSLEPLTEVEVTELGKHLAASGGASLDYARGIFTAAASGPVPLDPTTWLPWVLGADVPDKATLRQVIDWLVRDAQSIAECLELGRPWMPDSPPSLTQFCKGFTRVTQHGDAWQKATEVFIKLLPIAVTAGYVDLASIERFVPHQTSPAAAWLTSEQDHLSERLLELHRHFAPARAEQRQRPLTSEKVGRNEPCPCGSGKKHKKCCAH